MHGRVVDENVVRTQTSAKSPGRPEATPAAYVQKRPALMALARLLARQAARDETAAFGGYTMPGK
jgi:hypothetical protein